MEEKLIEAVRKRTALYDTSNADYLKKKLKLLIWEEIAKEIGMKSGSEAKTLWEKLRHSLRDALRRQKNCVKSGAAGIMTKPWRFQNKMGFLQPYIVSSKRETNLVHESDENDSNKQNQEECEDNYEEYSVVESRNEEHEDEGVTPGSIPTTQTQEISLDLSGSSSEDTPIPQKKIKKTESSATIHSILFKFIENREKRATERAAERAVLSEKVQPQSHPLYHFFMSMYESTKKMPSSTQLVVRNQIYKVVADMEATLLDIPQPNTFHPSLFIPYHDQHQNGPYCVSQHSTSTPLSSYSDSEALQSEVTTQNDPEVHLKSRNHQKRKKSLKKCSNLIKLEPEG